MVKETTSSTTSDHINPLSLHNHKHKFLFLKLSVSCLLVGLTVRLLFFDSFSFFSLPFLPHSPLLSSSPSLHYPLNHTQNSPKDAAVQKCDIFLGDWVPDPSGPMYTNESCHVIEDHQNCMRNGHPDTGYLYWRWSPRDCELPKFSPNKFLHIMRNKSWAFIGDSISRNHVQSLLCILSQVEAAEEVYHDKEYRSKIWKFPSHNFTLSVIWTPFLVKADIFEDMNGVSSSEILLYLDILDSKWTNQFNKFDYVVIAGGKWFLKTAIYQENGTVTGCHNCRRKDLPEVGFEYAYRKVLRQVLDFVVNNSKQKATVFLRTTAPDHFENGEWFSGGYCNRTVPLKEEGVNASDVDSVMRTIELEEFEKSVESIGGDHKLKLLDTTLLSVKRPDGHPGPFRQFHPLPNGSNVQNDCLHWCLPGSIDSWNHLLMQMLSL